MYGPDSVDPVRSWLMSLQTCAVSYESSLKVHATAWLRRAGVRVMSTCVWYDHGYGTMLKLNLNSMLHIRINF